MSWQIHCVENTIKISKKVAKAIYEVQKYEDAGGGEFFYGPNDVTLDGKLYFNSDNCEHQDFLSSCKDIVEILKKNKAKGRVAFLDIEQNSEPLGDWWAHEFDGKGGYKYLRGTATINWTQVTEPADWR